MSLIKRWIEQQELIGNDPLCIKTVESEYETYVSDSINIQPVQSHMDYVKKSSK